MGMDAFGVNTDWRGHVKSLHERQFGEKQTMDMARLSMAQQHAILQRSDTLQKMAVARSNYENKLRISSAANSAIAQITDLDPNKPDYLKKRSAIIGDLPDSLSSPAVQKLLVDGDKAFENFQKAETMKIGSKFSSPARQTYENVLQNTGDPGTAMTMAQQTQENFEKAKKIATSPHLSAADKATVFDSEKGTFNLNDSGNLAKLEVQHDSAENAQKQEMEQAKLTTEKATAATMTGVGGGRTPAPTATPAPAPAPAGAPSAEDELARLLGKTPAATPAGSPTALAVPAVTPNQSAGNPTDNDIPAV